MEDSIYFVNLSVRHIFSPSKKTGRIVCDEHILTDEADNQVSYLSVNDAMKAIREDAPELIEEICSNAKKNGITVSSTDFCIARELNDVIIFWRPGGFGRLEPEEDSFIDYTQVVHFVTSQPADYKRAAEYTIEKLLLPSTILNTLKLVGN